MNLSHLAVRSATSDGVRGIGVGRAARAARAGPRVAFAGHLGWRKRSGCSCGVFVCSRRLI
jgi:hypothetical protein